MSPIGFAIVQACSFPEECLITLALYVDLHENGSILIQCLVGCRRYCEAVQ